MKVTFTLIEPNPEYNKLDVYGRQDGLVPLNIKVNYVGEVVSYNTTVTQGAYPESFCVVKVGDTFKTVNVNKLTIRKNDNFSIQKIEE